MEITTSEYGNGEVVSEDADTSDCSVHQFTVKDEACEPLDSEDSDHNVHHLIAKDEARNIQASDDSEAHAAQNDFDRANIMSI